MNNAGDFKKTKPNKANPSTPRSGSGQAWLRACPELVEGTGFELGLDKMGHLEFLLLDFKDNIKIPLNGKKYGHK